MHNNNNNNNKIGVNKYKRRISRKSVLLIENLFKLAIVQTKYTENKLQKGTNYYFSSLLGLESGRIILSQKRNRMEKLVEICFALIKLAKSGYKTIEFDESFIQNVNSLIDELKK